MKTFLLTATYLVGIGELILGIFFWVTHSKSEIRKVMALLIFCTGLWAILNGLTSYVVASSLVSLFLDFLFVAGIWILTSLVHLAILFPYKIFQFDRLHVLFLYFPAVLFSVIVLGTNTIVAGYNINPNIPGYVIPGPLFSLYQITVSLFFFSAVILLLIKLKRLDGIHKRNTAIFLAGLLLGGSPAIIINLWAAFFGSTVNPLSVVICSVFWVGSITYIITKK